MKPSASPLRVKILPRRFGTRVSRNNGGGVWEGKSGLSTFRFPLEAIFRGIDHEAFGFTAIDENESGAFPPHPRPLSLQGRGEFRRDVGCKGVTL
jgi:hypothetical protein